MRKFLLIAVFLLGCAAGSKAQCSNTAYGAYTCKSTAYTFTNGTTSQTSTVSVTAGDHVILAAWSTSSSGTMAASSWGACGNQVNTGGSVGLTNATGIVVMATAISTGQCAIVVTDTVSSTIAARTWIWSGANSTDVVGNLSSIAVTASTTANCPAVTTVNNGDLIFCSFIDSTNNAGTWTAGTGFTGVTTSGVTVGGEAKVQTTAGAITPQFQYNLTAQVGVATVTLSTVKIPTLSTLNGITASNNYGNIYIRNTNFINPATGYVGKINNLTTPFTALPVGTFTDFHAGTNGSAPLVADLTSGTYGALFSYTNSFGSGMTYTNTVSAGNLPQPVLAGSNVYDASGSIGLLCTSSASNVTAVVCASAAQQFTWSTSSASVGFWYKASGSFPTTVDGGANGILTGGSDYLNTHVNGNGANCSNNGILVESKGGNSTDCLPFTPGTLYRINGQMNTGETPFTATFTNGSASIAATQTLAANQAVKLTTTGSLPTNFNLIISTGSYTSGITATGSIGQYCTLSSFNGGGSSATAQVYLNGTNSISSGNGLTWTNRGSGYTSAPTSATASNGTATCSGTVVVSTVLATPILFVSSTGLSGSNFQLSAVQGGTPIVAGSAGSGTHTVTVYDVVTVCTGNPPVFLGTMFATAFTTPSTPSAIQMGVSGEGPNVTGYTYFFGGYTLNLAGKISLTACVL